MSFSAESHVLRPSSENEERAEKSIKDWREYYVNYALHTFDFNVSTEDAAIKAMKTATNTSSEDNNDDIVMIGGTQQRGVNNVARGKADTGPPAELWQGAKPRQFGVHGYYCRLLIPNPTLQGGIPVKAGRGHA